MILISILALACVVITIYSGLYLLKNNEDSSKEKNKKSFKNKFIYIYTNNGYDFGFSFTKRC